MERDLRHSSFHRQVHPWMSGLSRLTLSHSAGGVRCLTVYGGSMAVSIQARVRQGMVFEI